MKKLDWVPFFLLLCTSFMSGKALAGGSQTSHVVYYAVAKDSSADVDTLVYSIISGRAGSSTGVFRMPATISPGQVLEVVSWQGYYSPTKIKTLTTGSRASDSACPQLDTTHWTCHRRDLQIDFRVGGDDCPWIESIYVVSSDQSGGGGTYRGPTARDSACPTVPVDSYDISWSKDSVVHDKTLSLDITGENGVMQTVIPTYLMEGGEFCDGSQITDRGAYCRFINTGVVVTPLGCDQPIVTSRVMRQGITDTVLDEITISIDTDQIGAGAFTAQCAFRYLIDQL